MKTLQTILQEITQLTTNIETNYPELYRSLDENPLTLQTMDHPQMNKEVLESYLKSLKELLSHHLETHQGKNN